MPGFKIDEIYVGDFTANLATQRLVVENCFGSFKGKWKRFSFRQKKLRKNKVFKDDSMCCCYSQFIIINN